MAFNVDEFRASVASRGLLKTNKFNVTFQLPPCFTGDPDIATYRSLCQDNELWCDSAIIPGVTFQTLKFRRYGYGSLDTVPVGVQFPDIQLRFIADGFADNWRLFHTWLNKSVNTDSSKGMWNNTTETSAGKALAPYETAWQGNIETGLVVTVFNDVGAPVKTIYCNQAIPTAVSDIKLDWGDNGDVARFMVNFAMQDWYATKITTLTQPVGLF